MQNIERTIEKRILSKLAPHKVFLLFELRRVDKTFMLNNLTKKRIKVPVAAFAHDYPEASYTVISPDNFWNIFQTKNSVTDK